MELLRRIGYENEHILSVYEMIGDDPKQVLVAEPVVSVENFFEERLKSFMSESEEKSRSQWWKYIADDFTTVFREGKEAVECVEKWSSSYMAKKRGATLKPRNER
ncbi:hypothetical protein RND81_06G030700 [Saponaria officinalis]|uniref:Uncharacterized protein n=1 Tax=Saponaria officinalis TaxID=3572 RepID=A0AAW1K6J9_SAPOF